jgi:oligopeptide/dipeptide ABC transporter ATP-binding protein
MGNDTASLLQVQDVKKHFVVDRQIFTGKRSLLRAVDGVSFDIRHGETFALVGESGCGKTTIGKMILGLTDITSGTILLDSRNLADYQRSEMKGLRNKVQVIFQDPYSALNPRKTIERIVSDPLVVQQKEKSGRRARLLEVLDAVGLSKECLNRYPHEFSGGQRQRVVIARALVLQPELVICDEPVSALDVSIRSQILNLLKSLQDSFHVTYLFISHDLSVVRYISNRIAVMYLGKLCEIADTEAFFEKAVHPYSQALLSVIPIPDPDQAKSRSKTILEGEIPSPVNPPTGCRFHTRCPHRQQICREAEPQLRRYANAQARSRYCACHFSEQFL